MLETLLAFSLALNQEPKVAIVQGTSYVIQASADISLPIEAVRAQIAPQQSFNGIECYCVTYARQFVPELPRGDADTILPNSTKPAAGSAVLFDYDGVRHVAAVLSVENGYIRIAEANFKKCQAGVRTISVNDIHILGYWSAPDFSLI